MSKSITDLLPVVQEKYNQFVAECAKQDIEILVTSTNRTAVEQDLLFLQPYDSKDNDNDGLVDEANEKVTNAKAGQSLHNWGVAFDVVPLVKGKAIWNDNALWSKLGQIGASVGLEWGGNWTSFPDKPHFQYTLGYTWQDFKEGKVDLSRFNSTQVELPVVSSPLSKEHIKKEITRLLNLL